MQTNKSHLPSLNKPFFSDLRNLNKRSEPLSPMKQSRVSYIQDPQKYDRTNKRIYNPKLTRRQNQLLWQQDTLQWIKISQINIHDLKPFIKQLYESCSYKKSTLFGLNVQSLKNQLQTNYNESKKNLYYLWSVFQTWNWESVGLKNLEDYIKGFPIQEDLVQQVAVENNKIKLNKLFMSLEINLITGQFNIGPKKHEFNRFLGQFYEKSITKISYESNSYQFKDTIRQIQSNQHLIAVKTDTQLFVINQVKKMKTFNIRAKDISVCKNKCYFARQNGSIGTIFMQISYQPKLNQLALQDTIYNDNLNSKQFFVSNNEHIFIVNINVEDEFISIRKLEGKINSFKLNIQPQQNEQLVNKKAFIEGNYMHVLFFLGIGRNLTRIVEYRFYMVDI